MLARSKKRTRQGGGFRAQFNTYNDRLIQQQEQSKARQPKELAAENGRGAAKIWNDDRSNRGRVERPEQEGADNQITARRERSGVVLEIAYDDEWVEVEIDPESAVNLIAKLQAALGGLIGRE